MKILVFEPMKKPYVKDIKDNIHAMQEIVGGSIEPIYFEPKQDAIVWCNDEFLLNGSEPNRIVGATLVHGTFYISGNYQNEYGEWDSCSLTNEQVEKYKEQFSHMIVDLPGIGLVGVNECHPEIVQSEEVAEDLEDSEEPEITMS